MLGALESRLALIPLLEQFAQIRTEASALDFADQVSLAARVASEVPAAGALARRMHKVVLLDEFQDTSVAQLQMLTDLFGPGHAACAVGDPQQAIYGWRGASAASLAGFAASFATREQPVLECSLSTSWRNDEAVLAVANRLAAPLRHADAGLTIPELHARPGQGKEPARSSRQPMSVPRPRRSAAGSWTGAPKAPRTSLPPPPRCWCAPAGRSPHWWRVSNSRGSRPRWWDWAGSCTVPRSLMSERCWNAPTTPGAETH